MFNMLEIQMIIENEPSQKGSKCCTLIWTEPVGSGLMVSDRMKLQATKVDYVFVSLNKEM